MPKVNKRKSKNNCPYTGISKHKKFNDLHNIQTEDLPGYLGDRKISAIEPIQM